MNITTPPTAAESLADALARLDDQRTALHHDAQSDAIRALAALVHAEWGAELATLRGAMHRLAIDNDRLAAMVAELHERWEQEIEGDGR